MEMVNSMNITNLENTKNSLNKAIIEKNGQKGTFMNLLSVLLNNKLINNVENSENSLKNTDSNKILESLKMLFESSENISSSFSEESIEISEKEDDEFDFINKNLMNMFYGIDLNNINLKYISKENNDFINIKNFASEIIGDNSKNIIESNNTQAKNEITEKSNKSDNLLIDIEGFNEKIQSEILLNENKVKEILSSTENPDLEDKKSIDYSENININVSIGKNEGVILENYNIEVSDPSSVIKKEIFNQVNEKINIMLDDKSQHVIMELNPEKLGKVDIKINYENEKIKIDITALNDKTKDIIGTNIKELTYSLENLSSNSFSNVEISINKNINYSDSQNLGFNNFMNSEGFNQRNSHERQNQNSFTSLNEIPEDNDIAEIINIMNKRLNKVI